MDIRKVFSLEVFALLKKEKMPLKQTVSRRSNTHTLRT